MFLNNLPFLTYFDYLSIIINEQIQKHFHFTILCNASLFTTYIKKLLTPLATRNLLTIILALQNILIFKWFTCPDL